MAASETQKNPKHGISDPISFALPDPLDNEKNSDLVEELKREKNYENEMGTKKRMATLKVLNRTTQEFVREVSRKQGLPPSQINSFGGKVYPYGSYRLGVFGPGSDIDTLAVAPQNVKREDFFSSFPDVLKRIVGQELAKEAKEKAKPEDREFSAGITSLVPVPDSFVPIIKLILNGIEIDLIFASIATLQTIPPKLNLNDNSLLMNLDQPSIRAITGPRVTDEILSLVPEAKTFRTALRAVKLWAGRRAVYANIVGYPGGVAWAMMVARVCQMYPHAVGATLVAKFFLVMDSWKWNTPVMLKHIEQPTLAQVEAGFKVWNPAIYKQDRNVMSIITPAFPSMCATYNITESTRKIIVHEIKRANDITRNIFAGTARWSDLFKKHTFFALDHKYYLTVIASAFDADTAKKWSGLVESKIRHLVKALEDMKAPNKVDARPFTKGFKRVHKYNNDDQIREIQKGSMKYKIEEAKIVESTDPELVTSDGNSTPMPLMHGGDAEQDTNSHTLHTYTYYIGIDTEAKGSLNLVPAFQIFKNHCTGWDRYNLEAHFINLAVSKSWDLPEDLFDGKDGDVRPSKPARKVIKPTNGESTAVRRSFNEVESAQMDGGGPTKRPRLMTATPTPTPTLA